VSGSELRFERVYDLPPEIVWDALVDSDLVSGWLAEADIEPRVGGRFNLEWRHFDTAVRTDGEIIDLVESALLVVETSNFGRTRVTLDELPGGPRGSSTLLSVHVDVLADRQFVARIGATWRVSLEQLAGLLHGYPVNWATWNVDTGPEWESLVAQTATTSPASEPPTQS
jgi:uncharacterized protein YndB with AHSA1/START domain